MMDQGLHVAFHLLPPRRPYLAVVDHDRTRIVLQPRDALADDTGRLAQLLDAHQVAIVAVAVDAYRDVKIHVLVDFVGLLLAQIPLDAGAAQHRPRKSQLHGALRSHDADIDGALLPDPIVREQRFVLIDAGRETADEIRDEIDQST